LITTPKLSDVEIVSLLAPDSAPFGWMSLGIAVDISLAAAQSLDRVIVRSNTEIPRVLGRCSIHVNDVDVVVECDERLLSISIRILRSFRAILSIEGEYVRLISLHPDHDSAYRE
jgi:hypothetical protein